MVYSMYIVQYSRYTTTCRDNKGTSSNKRNLEGGPAAVQGGPAAVLAKKSRSNYLKMHVKM